MNKKELIRQTFDESNDQNARGTGKTTALISRCKEINGTFVCYDEVHAKYLRKQYDVNTISVDRLHDLGHTGPVIFDTDALVKILGYALNETDKQESQLDRIKDIVNGIL